MFLVFVIAPPVICLFFFFNDTATTEIYTLSLHDALPIWMPEKMHSFYLRNMYQRNRLREPGALILGGVPRSEEHTSELQSQSNLVCRLLLEKKKYQIALQVLVHACRLRLATDRDGHGHRQ